MPPRPQHRGGGLVSAPAVIEQHDAMVAEARRQQFDGGPASAPDGRRRAVDD